MQQHVITFMSMLFLLSPLSSRAALVESSKFITEADIPNMTIAKYSFAGFVIGMVQQAAVTIAASDNIMMYQWIASLTGSLIASHQIDATIDILKQFDDRAIDWMYNELGHRQDQNLEQSFRTQCYQLRYGRPVSHAVCPPRDIYNAYKKLLTRAVKKQSFVGGYVVASAFGGVPSMAATSAIIKLGLMK